MRNSKKTAHKKRFDKGGGDRKTAYIAAEEDEEEMETEARQGRRQTGGENHLPTNQRGGAHSTASQKQ